MSIIDDEKIRFTLNNTHLESINLSFVNEEKLSTMEDIEMNIEISFNDNEEDYKNHGIIRIRHNLYGYVNRVNISLILFSEIKIEDNSMAFKEVIEHDMKELVKPGLNKASVVTSQLSEDFSHFPTIVDFYEMFINSQNNNNDD